MEPLEGNAWLYRGLLTVDWEICAHPLVRDVLRPQGVKITYSGLGQYALAELDPEFAKSVTPGDFLVAEDNIGYGHDHEHGPIALRGVGLGGVLCESAAPYFLRNCIDHGLPVVEVPGIASQAQTGDRLTVDLGAGTVRNSRTGTKLRFPPFPAFMLERLDAGGLYPWLAGPPEQEPVWS